MTRVSFCVLAGWDIGPSHAAGPCQVSLTFTWQPPTESSTSKTSTAVEDHIRTSMTAMLGSAAIRTHAPSTPHRLSSRSMEPSVHGFPSIHAACRMPSYHAGQADVSANTDHARLRLAWMNVLALACIMARTAGNRGTAPAGAVCQFRLQTGSHPAPLPPQWAVSGDHDRVWQMQLMSVRSLP